MTGGITLQEAIEFIWTEADLLDRRAYDQWLDLWADDGLYIIPIEVGIDDYATVLNYIYDDATLRRMRVTRLTSSQSLSAETVAETVRTVSRFVRTGGGADSIKLRAAQHLAEYKRGTHRLVPATLEIELRRDGDGIKIARKVVILASRQDGFQGTAYLL